MNLLQELNKLLEDSGIPIETGVFSGIAPEEYLVVIPMTDVFDEFADNLPQYEIQEARLELFSKGNYLKRKNQIVKQLLAAGVGITDRRYIGYEGDTGYHHYEIDVRKHYELKEDE